MRPVTAYAPGTFGQAREIDLRLAASCTQCNRMVPLDLRAMDEAALRLSYVGRKPRCEVCGELGGWIVSGGNGGGMDSHRLRDRRRTASQASAPTPETQKSPPPW